MSSSIGFIGLGAIGAPMALRVLRHGGRPLVVYNRSAARMQPLVDAGAEPAATPAEVAARCDVVLTCVTDGAALEQVVFGDGTRGAAGGGVAGSARPGLLLVDLSTIHPMHTRELARRAHEAAAMRWVDAPVSGGPGGAAAGTLAVMAGGDADDVARARPLLQAFASQVTHMGPVGCGHAAKACNQMINVANAAAIAEAMNLASRFGVDPRRLPAALAGGYADSGFLRHYGPLIAEGRYAGDTRITLKDLDIVLDLAARTGSALPVTALIASLYRLLAARGHLHDGVAGLARLYADPADPRRDAAGPG